MRKTAKHAIERKNYRRGIQIFEAIQARFPFTEYGKQSQIDLIYAYYKSGRTEQAIDAADQFMRENPTHPRVDYALYLQGLTWFDAESALPNAVTARREGQWATVPRVQLQAGDTVLVRAGDIVPVDAQVTEGVSAVKEDTFNGEPLPRPVAAGDTVYGGTVNVESALQARVLGSYLQSRLAALQRSVETAQTEKPRPRPRRGPPRDQDSPAGVHGRG